MYLSIYAQNEQRPVKMDYKIKVPYLKNISIKYNTYLINKNTNVQNGKIRIQPPLQKKVLIPKYSHILNQRLNHSPI
jgi:hypothetical protein